MLILDEDEDEDEAAEDDGGADFMGDLIAWTNQKARK